MQGYGSRRAEPQGGWLVGTGRGRGKEFKGLASRSARLEIRRIPRAVPNCVVRRSCLYWAPGGVGG